jgi:hypothetical protein
VGVVEFVQPAGSGGRPVDQCGFARPDETGRRESSPTGRRSAQGGGERDACHPTIVRFVELAPTKNILGQTRGKPPNIGPY